VTSSVCRSGWRCQSAVPPALDRRDGRGDARAVVTRVGTDGFLCSWRSRRRLEDVFGACGRLRELGVTPLSLFARETDEPSVIGWMPAAAVLLPGSRRAPAGLPSDAGRESAARMRSRVLVAVDELTPGRLGVSACGAATARGRSTAVSQPLLVPSQRTTLRRPDHRLAPAADGVDDLAGVGAPGGERVIGFREHG
jgi:hypothetical protein